MPLYEYLCRRCEKSFEVLQKMGADSKGLDCPTCGDSELEKLYSSFAANSSSGTGSSAATGCGAPACGTGFT